MPMVARWRSLLNEYPDFKRWHENLARGSIITAKENARVLYRFMNMHDMTPQSMID